MTWLRLRWQSGAGLAGMLQAFVFADQLLSSPVGGQPLSQWLASQGLLVSADPDVTGVTLTVVGASHEMGRVISTLPGIWATVEPPPDHLTTSIEDVLAWWAWTRQDADDMADVLGGLATHTPARQWSRTFAELKAAAADPETARSVVEQAAATVHLSQTPTSAIIVGAAPGQEATDALRDWLPQGRPMSPSAPAEVLTSETVRLPVVSQRSTLLRLAWRVPPRRHPDYASLAVAARHVGGHYHAVLAGLFRHERRWSYSPWALLRSGVEHGLLQVSVRVPTVHVEEAVQIASGALQELRLSGDEVRAAQQHVRMETKRLWSAGRSAAGLVGYWNDLGLDPHKEGQRWLHAIEAVDAAAVADAADRWVNQRPHLVAQLSPATEATP
jgi:hypothetical protein